MTPFVTEVSRNLLAQLANAGLRSLVVGIAAGAALSALRVKSTSVRLLTWTLVLYAGLLMPLLGWMLPTLPIAMPALVGNRPALFEAGASGTVDRPQTASFKDRSVVAIAGRSAVSPASEASRALAVRQSPAPDSARPSSLVSSLSWSVIAFAIYTAVALLLFVRFFLGLVLGGKLRRTSQSICDPRLTSLLASRAQSFGLASAPPIAESELICVPVTMGAIRPIILLPSDWREWDEAKLEAVIAHELSHVARHDALTQRLSLMHRAIFWFSPLAWWLDRRLATLAEQASDETALSCGADRKDYAAALLDFFEALRAAPGRVWWQGVAMAKAGEAEQRVERILAWRGAVAMNLKRSVVIAVITLAVPVVYLAAAAHPMSRVQSAQTANPSAAPAATVTPAVPSVAPLAPMSGQTASQPVASVAPVAAQSASFHHRYSYSYGYDDDGQRFVIVSGNSDSVTMSGSTEDERHAMRLKKQIPGDFIWFERDEKAYVIRDQATVDRARKLWAPQEELGKKQEELGKQQEVLGKQQEALGDKMRQVHVKVPDLTAQLDRLKEELKRLSSGATTDEVGQIQSEIGELQSRVGELQSQAGEQQSKVGEQMSALGEQQSKLGEQQSELGRQQGELAAEAMRKLGQLFDEAIANGVAQPEL
jgi:beta-lactamase regulating signal transducer with metallopeptidase domain